MQHTNTYTHLHTQTKKSQLRCHKDRLKWFQCNHLHCNYIYHFNANHMSEQTSQTVTTPHTNVQHYIETPLLPHKQTASGLTKNLNVIFFQNKHPTDSFVSRDFLKERFSKIVNEIPKPSITYYMRRKSNGSK